MYFTASSSHRPFSHRIYLDTPALIEVGTIDIEAPCEERSISDFKLKGSGDPAFPLSTVLFSLYYPAKNVKTSWRPHYWIPKPISITAEGYLRFGSVNNFITNTIVTGALWLLVGGITIPAKVDLPLDEAIPKLELQDGKKFADAETGAFPVLVFSHGFASSRTDYTHYLGELASRGYVVAAIEHRDGSGPGSVVRKDESRDRYAFPIKKSHLQSHPKLDTASFKQVQLDFRQAEIHEALRVLRRINNGKGESVYQRNTCEEGLDLENWIGRLNMNEVTMGGHSFGGTAALQALRPSNGLPFKGGIVLDPGKSSGPLNADIDVPLLIIHSNSWSRTLSIFYERPHFDVVKELVQGVLARGKDAWFLTSLGTTHPSVTDAPLIEPLLLSMTTGSTIDVKEGVEQYVMASHEFLRYQHTGERTGLLAQNVSHPEYKDNHGGRGENLLDKKYARFWEVHVAPEAR